VVTTVNILEVRRRLGRRKWRPPVRYGPDGWSMFRKDGKAGIRITVAPWEDGTEWVHASIAAVGRTPTYEELLELHRAVFCDGHAYQIFVPETEHINIHATALHLWGRVDGKPELPNFGKYGTI
jgi:hypothetical protein